MIFSWSTVASVFASPITRAAAVSYPVVGFAIVQFLSENEELSPGRLCRVIDCESVNSDLWNIAIGLDQYNLPFLYYSILLFSVSYYLYMIFCWSPIKKYQSLLGILNAFRELDDAVSKSALAEHLGVNQVSSKSSTPTLIGKVYHEKNTHWLGVTASALMVIALGLIMLSSLLQIFITTVFLMVVELGWLQHLALS